jgi:hypothetical protein
MLNSNSRQDLKALDSSRDNSMNTRHAPNLTPVNEAITLKVNNRENNLKVS